MIKCVLKKIISINLRFLCFPKHNNDLNKIKQKKKKCAIKIGIRRKIP